MVKRKRVVYLMNFAEINERRRLARLAMPPEPVDNEKYRELYKQSGLKASVWVKMIGISYATHASYKTDRLAVPKERYVRMLEVVRHSLIVAKGIKPKRKYTKQIKQEEDFLE